MKNRDYTRQYPGEKLTNTDARHRYLHELLRKYMKLSVSDVNNFVPCRRIDPVDGCARCVFTSLLGNSSTPCCWKAEADPDYAIDCLEEMLGIGLTGEVWDAAKNAEWLEKVDEILSYYPSDGQLAIAQEECAELIKAISKIQRYGVQKGLANLVEEIADVRIMCAQLVEIFKIGSEVNVAIDAKLDRTLERIEKEKRDAQKHA